jgi:fucose 4-O-acetylase-like acetyltransferase
LLRLPTFFTSFRTYPDGSVPAGDDRRLLSEDLFFVRGISILLVVLVHVLGLEGHQGLRGLFESEASALKIGAEFIDVFNMAVMFVGSSVAWRTFGRGDTSVKAVFEKKVKKLVVPLLIWLPVLMVAESAMKGHPLTFAGVFGGLIDPEQASIFWFIHALLWCTLLGWAFRRCVPRLEWLFPVALIAHVVASRFVPASYAAFVLYWFCYFAFGIALQPVLPRVRGWLEAQRGWSFAVAAILFAVLVLLYRLAPETDAHQGLRPLAGPTAFFFQLTLAVTLGDLFRRTTKRLTTSIHAFMVECGSISMTLYIFHIYFVSGSRIALSRIFHVHSLPLHLIIGWTIGFAGPYALWRRLRNNRLFLVSVGMVRQAARVPLPSAAPLSLQPA